MTHTRTAPLRFYGTSVLDSPRLIEKAGVAADGVVFAVVQPGLSGDETARRSFISAYVTARTRPTLERALQSAGQQPGFAAFHVYDAVSLAFQAMNLIAAREEMNGNTLQAQLRTTKYTGITGNIAFDRHGDLAADRTVVFKRVEFGKIATLSE